MSYLAKLADAQQLQANMPSQVRLANKSLLLKFNRSSTTNFANGSTQSIVQQGHPLQHPPRSTISVPSATRFGVQLDEGQQPQQQQQSSTMQGQRCMKPGATSGLHQFGGERKQDGLGTGADAADFL